MQSRILLGLQWFSCLPRERKYSQSLNEVILLKMQNRCSLLVFVWDIFFYVFAQIPNFLVLGPGISCHSPILFLSPENNFLYESSLKQNGQLSPLLLPFPVCTKSLLKCHLFKDAFLSSSPWLFFLQDQKFLSSSFIVWPRTPGHV